MARKSTALHIEKGFVHALYDSAETIRTRGNALVGLLGGATFGGWIWTEFLQHPDAIVSAENYVWQGCLILYFTSWVTGVGKDGAVQRKVYVSAPENLKPSTLALGCAVLIFGLFALMFLVMAAATVETKPSALLWLNAISQTAWIFGFAVFQNILWFANIPIWRYYVNTFINPMEARSQRLYREQHDEIGAMRVRIVADYIKGRWQWYRYAVGAVLLLGYDGAVWFCWRLGHDPKPVLTLGLAGFLGVVELWIWAMRLKVDHSMECVEQLARRFEFIPRDAAAAEAARKARKRRKTGGSADRNDAGPAPLA